ncbi:MAG: SRPBCC family protein [Gaiellaceae bacterium]
MSDRTIAQTIEIDATPETVFRALTDADELSRWWTTRAESDPRPGGSFSYTWEFAQDTERNHTREDTYEDVTPNEHIRYAWPMPLGNTVVDFRLEPSGEGTKLTLAHEGWGSSADWAESHDMHVSGWQFFLGNLKSYLERGEDARASAMGLKTAASV